MIFNHVILAVSRRPSSSGGERSDGNVRDLTAQQFSEPLGFLKRRAWLQIKADETTAESSDFVLTLWFANYPRGSVAGFACSEIASRWAAVHSAQADR